ncbi:MAG: exosortase-associated EpsI family protein [Phycisphaerae bacterium]|nr:exosortase-associated EpsI family protein [Phycisphaerae bacterium]NIT59845.1 exosortase-associated EpsI family protein [Fodinibius sp.]NIU11379.1 exosortase-associated EpsI family protein [Phycisphaerae bacterium]NIU59156.1 exosortase-associated EpsI family protein [Phycisphaerae bacterium]NIV14575.1 exosortase-associated EpsI family protein [Fodinibius sp.]
MLNRKPNKFGQVSGLFIWIFAVLLLVSSGITYRLLASHLEMLFETPVSLPVPLGAFPAQVYDWIGTDLTIPNITKEYIEKNFADDFLSRRYTNTSTQKWADVYVVYCSSRPGSILGHRPRVCYPANGWVHDGTESSQFVLRTGRSIPCLIHRFHKPTPAYDQKVILNFYILNGQITTREDDFSGPFGRRPNITGNPARYVAQVQISSVFESSIRTAAKDITGLVLDFLPDKDGKVRTNEFQNIATDVLK